MSTTPKRRTRVGTITLYFDREAYAAETDGDRLTKAELERIGKEINDEVAASWCGYEGWATKFITLGVPAKRVLKTLPDGHLP